MITLLNKFDDNYIIHTKDVLEIVSYYIKEDNLEDYIKDIWFDNKYKYTSAYNVRTHMIILNDDKLLKHCYKMFDDLSRLYKIDEEYYTYFINFYYLFVLFHEIEHAKQVKKYELNSNNQLYSFLFELCRKIQKGDQAFYQKHHDLFSTEIEANNNGYLKAYNLLSYTKLPGRETKIMYLQYLFSLLYNYEKINNYRILTPIEKLKEENPDVDIDKIFTLLDEANMSKIERMNLGLCITPKEFDSTIEERQKILCRKDFLRK